MGKLIGSSIDLFCLQRLAVADLEPLPTSWACKCNAKKGRYLGSVEEKSLTWHEHILNKKSWSIVLLQLVLFSLFVLYNTRVERAPHVWEGFWQGFDLEILSLSEFQYIYIHTYLFWFHVCFAMRVYNFDLIWVHHGEVNCHQMRGLLHIANLLVFWHIPETSCFWE